MLLQLSSCVNVTRENLLSAPTAQIHNKSNFHSVSTTTINMTVRSLPSTKHEQIETFAE